MGCGSVRGYSLARPCSSSSSILLSSSSSSSALQHHPPASPMPFLLSFRSLSFRAAHPNFAAAVASAWQRRQPSPEWGLHPLPRRHLYSCKLQGMRSWSVRRPLPRMCRLRVECCCTIAGSDSVFSSQKPRIFVPKLSFCPTCGGAMEERIPQGEHELRSICTVCGCVHYQNPKMVVGCLVEHDNKILLCRRKIQPSYGLCF